MRKTRVGELVVDLLQTYARPFSLRELHLLVLEPFPRTAFSTIYRVISRLEAEGKVERVDWRERGSRYEWAELPHHHHIVCGVCGRSVDVDDADLGFSEQRIRDATGFLVNHHSIELEGICPDCQG
jgi:Fur family transcriptional regulator, ferric uptake regulator